MPETGSAKTGPAVVEIDPITDRRWDAVLSRHRSDVFHSPAWLSVLQSYGFEARARVVESPDGIVTGGMVFCEVTRDDAPHLVSLPFSDFADPLVASVPEWNAIVGSLDPDVDIELRVLRDQISRADPMFERVERSRWHCLDLTDGIDAVWERMRGSGRRAIRKGEKAPVEVVAAGSLSDVRTFFDLHLAVRKYKYRLLAQPYWFFEAIWDRFLSIDRGELLLARYEGKTVAGTLFLQWGDTLFYKYNASDETHLELFPNDLLVWHAILRARERGLRHLDFGLSGWDQEGLIRFKSKFGSREGRVDVLRSTFRLPSANPLAARLGEVTQILTHPDVPDVLTERAGEALYRFFA